MSHKLRRHTIVSVQDFDKLWLLFREYHKEVSIYLGEMSLPDESMFLNFWQKEKKWSYFLTFNNNPVGFVLLQIIRESKTNAMEVGAIFVKKENRSINSLKLYRKSLECANDNNLALVSEIAKDNSHSINVFNTLKKRYSRSSNLRFMRKDIDANRVLVSCEIE